jgi:UDP:flavonoid glycosyltransferase YjiC (YdhE family)
MPPGTGSKRILLIAEAVTLAHVARPLCFASGLDRRRYEVAIAAAPRAAEHIHAAGQKHLPLFTIEPAQFLAALARGAPVYDTATLERYVDADLELIEAFRPDLVVGDFRLSLSVSARLAAVPYLSIASAYWSPHYSPPRWTVPDLPLSRLLPLALAQPLFAAVRPIAFAAHCRPLNAVRRRRGLAPLPSDLRVVYTDADWVAYADLPELFPMPQRPAAHRFVGPALWEPHNPPPPWWEAVPADRPVVYLSMGSSGDGRLLPTMVGALSRLPVTLLVATAGAAMPPAVPSNVLAAPYLPGLQACARSTLVVCNGGNLTAYQAAAAGVPVLGVAGNLDQFLNMAAFEAVGAGLTLRADRLSAAALSAAAERMLAEPAHGAARALQESCGRANMPAAAAALVEEILR